MLYVISFDHMQMKFVQYKLIDLFIIIIIW